VLSTLWLAKFPKFAHGVQNDVAPWGASGGAQKIDPKDLGLVGVMGLGGHLG